MLLNLNYFFEKIKNNTIVNIYKKNSEFPQF